MGRRNILDYHAKEMGQWLARDSNWKGLALEEENRIEVVQKARRALGPVGVLLPVVFTAPISLDQQRGAVARLEDAGFRAAWTNEVVGGKDALVQCAVLLADTGHMVFGTSIANIWAREPQTAHGAAALLAQAYPERFVLGLGVGYPFMAESVGRDFGQPIATMRRYLERMSAETMPPAPSVTFPRIIASNGPKMLALARDSADGALPANLRPPEVTAMTRRLLGPDKLLVVSLSAIVDSDRTRAKERARAAVTDAVRAQPFVDTLIGAGYSVDEVTNVCDRLVDSAVAYGDMSAVQTRVKEHLAAGADHVVIWASGATDFEEGIDQFELIAPAVSQVA